MLYLNYCIDQSCPNKKKCKSLRTEIIFTKIANISFLNMKFFVGINVFMHYCSKIFRSHDFK